MFWKGRPAPVIPFDEVKAREVLREIDLLKVHDNPLSISFLLRLLIELSDKYYRRNKINDKDKLAKNVNASVDSMLNKELLTSSEAELIKAYTNTNRDDIDIFNIDTLQKYLHRDSHLPTPQILNTFWDEICCFINACWHQK